MSKRGSLSGRLSRLKKEGLSPPVRKENKSEEKKDGFGLASLTGWEEIHRHVWRRTVLRDNPLKEIYGNSLIMPPDQNSSEFLFYDTETTGLSTGAGTIPFLIGLGRIRGDQFEIVQYFLADYPGEPDLLNSLKNDFPDDSLYISYNGKSYDSHLINTRFLMNGIKAGHREEVDLLYMSRRLWKSLLENCRLGTIEEHILTVQRGPDIPGAEIPDVWFDFLKNGRTDRLELVFSHNLQDIYSLALLLHIIEKITDGEADHINFDRFALARMLLFHNRPGAEELMIDEFEAGNRAAGQFLSLYYKRQGLWEQAIELWEKLNRTGCHFFSVEELAKCYEHKTKNYEKALTVVDKMLKGPIAPTGDVKEKLLYRRNRLIEKLKK